jgi:hypothetical protein
MISLGRLLTCAALACALAVLFWPAPQDYRGLSDLLRTLAGAAQLVGRAP